MDSKITSDTGKNAASTNKKKEPSCRAISETVMDSISTSDAAQESMNIQKMEQPSSPLTSEMVIDLISTTDAGEDALNTQKKKQLNCPPTSEMVMDSNNNAYSTEDIVNTNEKKQPKLPLTSEIVVESIKVLNSSNGSSLRSIKASIRGLYGANIKLTAKKIARFVEIGVKDGIIEQVTDNGGSNRFKLKETARPTIKTTSEMVMDSISTSDAGQEAMNTQKMKQPSSPPTSEMVMDLISTADAREDAMNTQKKKQLNRPPTSEMVMDSNNNADTTEDIMNTNEKKQPRLPLTSEIVVESIKVLNSSNGSSLRSIKASIRGLYGANIKLTDKKIARFVEIGVKDGIIEQVTDNGGSNRFKLKETARPTIKTTSEMVMDSISTSDAGQEAMNTQKMKQPSSPSTSEMVMDLISTADASEDAMNTQKKKQLNRPTTSEMVMDSNNNADTAEDIVNTNENKQSRLPLTSEMAVELTARFAETSVKDGILEQVTENGDSNRFKLKETARPTIKTTPEVEEVQPMIGNRSNSYGNSKSTVKNNQPFLPQNVIESIKSLNVQKGAPVDAICRHMEEHYGVNVKEVSPKLEIPQRGCAERRFGTHRHSG